MDLKNQPSCSNLSNYISHIRGLRKTSASPSDVWFITFRPRVTYGGNPVDRAVIKVFFSEATIPDDGDDEGRLVDSTIGLNYEARVYSKIINPLLDGKCPYFIRLFDSSTCSYKDMVRLLSTEFKNDARARFDRIFDLIIASGDDDDDDTSSGSSSALGDAEAPKPALQDYINPNYHALTPLDNLKYSFIMLREFTPRHKDMHEYILSRDFRYPIDYDVNFWLVLYQIAVGLYAMELVQLVHNDFHLKNCIIETLAEPSTITQAIQDSNGNWLYYQYTSNVRVVIFDFDRAYSPLLGKNKSLTRKCEDDFGYQCNKFVPGRDLAQMFCYLLSFMNDPTPENIRLVASQITPAVDDLLAFEEKTEYCTDKDVPRLYPLPRVIYNLAKKAKLQISANELQSKQWVEEADAYYFLEKSLLFRKK